MRSRTSRFLAVVVIALLGAAAGGWFVFRDVASKGPVAATAPPAVEVQPVVEKGVSRAFEFVGRIKAVNEVELRARVEGFLEKILFVEGQLVEAGQLLYQIEKVQFQTVVDESAANVTIDEAQLINAQLEYDRSLKLSTQQFGTQALVDANKAKLELAKGKLQYDKAALVQAQANLSYTDIRAPVKGRIGRTQYTLGNLVNPGSGALATIVSVDPIYVQFPVSVRELHTVRDAREAGGRDGVLAKIEIKIRLATGDEYPHSATWNFTDPRVDKQTDSLIIRATLPNPDGLLSDGEFVTVVVRERAPEQKLVMPQSALLIDQSGYYALIVDRNHRVVQRRVKTGPNEGLDVVVQSGLAAGDNLIVEGIQKVRPGQIVQETVVPRPPGG